MKTKRYHWFARDNELLLDLDTPESIAEFYDRCCGIGKYVVLDSVTPEHKHVFITLTCDMPAEQRIAMSVQLGSDPRRASADLARHQAGAEHFQCLMRFDKPTGVREPDLVCFCPMNWKGVRLRACIHLREYEPHKYWSGTQKKTAS